MAALPTVGESEDTWGTELNEFLGVEHGAGGYHTTFEGPIDVGGTSGVTLGLTTPSSANAGILYLRRRDTTVSAGNQLGRIDFTSDDATSINTAAVSIRAYADGDWDGGTDTPGNLSLWTAPATTGVLAERVRVDSDGNVCIGTTSADSKLHVKQAVDSIDGGITLESVDGTNEWSFDTPNAGALRVYKATTGIARFISTGFAVLESSPSAYADITLGGSGALCVKETTTPTADADYGKIYCKADNKLYFQDGAGAEHEVSLAT